MKRINILLLLLLAIFAGLSCIKVETNLQENRTKPEMRINIKLLDSEKWKRAYLVVSSVNFAELTNDHNGSGSGTVQNWDGILLDFDLSQRKDKKVLEEPYWESTLLGIDPNFLGSTFVTAQNVFVDDIHIDYLDYIPFGSQIEIRNGKKYEINLILNLDEIIEQYDSTTVLNISKIFASIAEL